MQQLNYAAGLFQEFGMSVGNAWTQALTGIADHTRTVAQAFREMARSILQSMAQIASQEAFKALIGLGTRLLFGAVGGTAGAGTVGAAIGGEVGMASGGAPSGFLSGISAGTYGGAVPMQHGGVITRPTAILAGENPATNPEVILNRFQLQALMSGGPSAGGQAAGGISIFNSPSRDAAEAEAASQRALGKQVVMNEVMSDLQKGSGSQIGRMLRLMQ